MSYEDGEERDPTEIGILKQRLEARLIELEELSETSRASRETVDLDQSRVGRLSRMDALQQQEMQRAAELRREQERQRIRFALQLISDDAYGYCVRCDDLISMKRLRLDPSLITCVNCS